MYWGVNDLYFTPSIFNIFAIICECFSLTIRLVEVLIPKTEWLLLKQCQCFCFLLFLLVRNCFNLCQTTTRDDVMLTNHCSVLLCFSSLPGNASFTWVIKRKKKKRKKSWNPHICHILDINKWNIKMPCFLSGWFYFFIPEMTGRLLALRIKSTATPK